jgi:hypothetical protein
MNANKILIIAFSVELGWTIASGAELVTDEATRLKVVAAMFPGMSITATDKSFKGSPGQTRFGPVVLSYTDPFAGETIYRVTGAPRTGNENCASQDVASLSRSFVRELMVRVYLFGMRDYIAVAQYSFIGVSPAGACWSIAQIAFITNHNAALQLSSAFEPNTTHHAAVNRIEFPSLAGEASQQLLIESDVGGGDFTGSDLFVFDLSNRRLAPILETLAFSSDWTKEEPEVFTQSLDLSRTRSLHGRQFCFTKTTYVVDDGKVSPPKITHPCYRRGEGVERQ